MRRFLIVGCGGSGGTTLRFMMDQLLADLRPYGVTTLPPAWQFLHIDVPTSPDSGPGNLGTIRELGGRYHAVSTLGNTYVLTANQVEQTLSGKGNLRGLLGWAPSPKSTAASVPVTNGAGQFRAVGRMLTLTNLSGIQDQLRRAWEELQRPDVWGDVPPELLRSFDGASDVVPIVVGSMAGGSGASMFLDVCRLMGRLNGLPRADLGVFLYTADVFGALPEAMRTGIEGNALGALGEIIAAQAGASDEIDAELMTALGLPPESSDSAAFARVFPVGASIGGDGAKFGGGTQDGVYRGLGRALAAMLMSTEATKQYINFKIGNPTPLSIRRDLLGWGASTSTFPWGSIGYASLSLGRDRYSEYAAQRVARVAFDRLVRGHLDPESHLPSTEQLSTLVDAQWSTTLERLGLPVRSADPRAWLTSVAFPDAERLKEARRVASDAVAALESSASAPAAGFVDALLARLPHFQQGARDRVTEAAYSWAVNFSEHLEARVTEEFLTSMSTLGIPYSRAVAGRLREHCGAIIDELRVAGADGPGNPLEVRPEVVQEAAGLKKTVVSTGHRLVDLIRGSFEAAAAKSLNREVARLAAEVLHSFANDVCSALERCATDALANLEHAERETTTEAGLAQLATTAYLEWPTESDTVPPRFDHADNEVLLTTSAEFAERFQTDVSASVPSANRYADARETIVGEVIVGRWETTGGRPGRIQVLSEPRGWRPSVLPISAATKVPTPASQPIYRLATAPKELLERARAHIRRPDQPFERFSTQTISDFLTEPGQPDSTLADRRQRFVSKFMEALRLGRPLVGVSAAMVSTVHPGETLRYEYAFGNIGLEASDPVAAQIQAALEADKSLDESVQFRFRDALGTSKAESRIAFFGSYPKYSPLVFNSLLEPMQQRWAGAPDQMLGSLWRWKRTRPLQGGIGMTREEQRTVIAGWFLGRLLGMVRVPPGTAGADPVQVWDSRSSRWLAFPHPLLSGPATFRGPDDWLPAVLESHSLAIVNCNGDTTLAALQPYRALRDVFDSSSDEPVIEGNSFKRPAAEERLAAWFSTGTWPSGVPSEVLVGTNLSSQLGTVATRSEAAIDWLERVSHYFKSTYLTQGSGYGALGTDEVRVPGPEALEVTPMFAQVAEAALEAVERLTACARSAQAAAETQAGGQDGSSRPLL